MRKRPNCRLVSTGLEYGDERFRGFEGKNFHPSLNLTRRVSVCLNPYLRTTFSHAGSQFYPHKHNMDGFFVAKFKVEKRTKQAQANGAAEEPAQMLINDQGEIVEDGVGTAAFDDLADQAYIEGG